MRLLFLMFLVAGVVAAQTAPPRKDIPTIAKAANGAIVSIIMSDKNGHDIAQGTGFLISKDGRVVTNYHVIENGSSAIAKLPDGAFFLVDGVLAFDKARDVAVIKARGENFRTLTLGNSDRLQVGEEVIAIGNPLSLESTVSNGIVSGIRTVEAEGGKFLQITAPISHGSSGGPLFNMAGEVIGITSSGLRGGENLNFAIPINDAKSLFTLKFSKVSNFPDEPEATEVQSANGKSSAASDQSSIEKAQHELSQRVAILWFNINHEMLFTYPNGIPFPQRNTEHERQEAWRPKYDPKGVVSFNDGLGCVHIVDVNNICAPADLQARLAMELLREEWDNTKNVPEGKSLLIPAYRNAIVSLWSEEKTLYCVLRPEAQYIELNDTLKDCVQH
jgi:hypothetical protein